MRTYWIVVANADHACVYRKAHGANGLELVHRFGGACCHDQAQSGEEQRHCCEKHDGKSALPAADNSPEISVHQLADDLCRLVDVAAQRHAYDELVLFAPAPLLSLLRGGLTAATRRLPLSCLAKDLSPLPLPDLESRLSDLLHFRTV